MEPEVIVLLPGFTLPSDYAWRVGIVHKVERHLRQEAEKAAAASRRYLNSRPAPNPTLPTFRVPRFTGYYFIGEQPVALTAFAKVHLDRKHPIIHLAAQVEAATNGEFRITNAPGEEYPLYMLIHDRHVPSGGADGSCVLMRFEHGRRFVTATEPIVLSEV